MRIIIDAASGVLGRIASFAAKQTLLGKEVAIVNCSEVLITGNKAMILEKYKRARARGGSAQRGPYFPRSPERIMKRTVRGMLSHKQGRGREALKKLRCYDSVPAEFEKEEKISMKRKIKVKAIKLSEVAREL